MQLAKSTARVLKRFLKVSNFPVTLENNNTLARWKIPGFTYDQLDRSGYPSVYKLIRILESARNIRLRFPELMPVSNHVGEPNKAPIMFAQHMDVSQSLYDKARCDFPMTVEWTMFELGTTSMVMQDTIREDSTGETMMKTLRKFVYVDLEKRHPSIWPQKFVDQYQDFLVKKGEEKFPALIPLKIPDYHHSSEVRITHSELDQIFHTNQSNYLKYSMDCACEAAEAGLLKRFDEDLCFYHAKSASVIHRGESFVGDRLKVHAWQDPEDVNLLKFVIKKADVDIYYATVTMFR